MGNSRSMEKAMGGIAGQRIRQRTAALDRGYDSDAIL